MASLAEEGRLRVRSAVVEPLLRIRSSITSWALASPRASPKQQQQADVASIASSSECAAGSLGVLLLQQRPLDSLGRGLDERPALLQTFGPADQATRPERVYDEPRVVVRAPDRPERPEPPTEPAPGPPRNLSIEFKDMFPPMRRIVMPEPKAVALGEGGDTTATEGDSEEDDLLDTDEDVHPYHYPYGADVHEPPYYDTPFTGFSDVNKVAIAVCPTPSPRYLTMRPVDEQSRVDAYVSVNGTPASLASTTTTTSSTSKGVPKGGVFKLSLFSGSSHSNAFTEDEAPAQPLDRVLATSDAEDPDDASSSESDESSSDDGVASVLRFPGAAGLSSAVTNHYSNVHPVVGSSWSLISDDDARRPVFGDPFDTIKYNSLRRGTGATERGHCHYSNVSEYFDHQRDPLNDLALALGGPPAVRQRGRSLVEGLEGLHHYSNTACAATAASICSEAASIAASSFRLSHSRSMQSVSLLDHVLDGDLDGGLDDGTQPLDLSLTNDSSPPPMAPQPSPRKGAQVFRRQSYKRPRDNSMNPHRDASAACSAWSWACQGQAGQGPPPLSEICIRTLLRHVTASVRTTCSAARPRPGGRARRQGLQSPRARRPAATLGACRSAPLGALTGSRI